MTTSNRDSIRSKILSSKKLNSKIINFFGAEVEIRQPDLGKVIEMREVQGNESVLINSLIEQVFVPGTNEKVFEDADIETLKTLPFGADFVNLSKALEELSEINFQLPNSGSPEDQKST